MFYLQLLYIFHARLVIVNYLYRKNSLVMKIPFIIQYIVNDCKFWQAINATYIIMYLSNYMSSAHMYIYIGRKRFGISRLY